MGSLPGARARRAAARRRRDADRDLHLAGVGHRGALRGGLRRAAACARRACSARGCARTWRRHEAPRAELAVEGRAGGGDRLHRRLPAALGRPLLPEHDHPVAWSSRSARWGSTSSPATAATCRSGQGAFLGLGAYTVGDLCTTQRGRRPVASGCPRAGVVAGLFAALLGVIAMRTRGHAFVILTIAFLFLCSSSRPTGASLTNGTARPHAAAPDLEHRLPVLALLLLADRAARGCRC